MDTGVVLLKWFIQSDVEDLYEDIPKSSDYGSDGIDFKSPECFSLGAGKRKMVGLKVYTEIPKGYTLFITPRSGYSYKYGLSIVNTPGAIDSSYRGELKVILINTSNKDIDFQRGDKICQGFVIRTPEVINRKVESLDELSKTDRGSGGFGHTGR